MITRPQLRLTEWLGRSWSLERISRAMAQWPWHCTMACYDIAVFDSNIFYPQPPTRLSLIHFIPLLDHKSNAVELNCTISHVKHAHWTSLNHFKLSSWLLQRGHGKTLEWHPDRHALGLGPNEVVASELQMSWKRNKPNTRASELEVRASLRETTTQQRCLSGQKSMEVQKSYAQWKKWRGKNEKKKKKISELGLNYQGILSFTLYLQLRPKSCNHWVCKETSGKIMNHGKLQKGRDKSCEHSFLQPFVGICPVSWHSALYWRKGVLPAWQSLCGPRVESSKCTCGTVRYMRSC